MNDFDQTWKALIKTIAEIVEFVLWAVMVLGAILLMLISTRGRK